MANKQYKLELTRGYPQDSHHRAGLVLQRGGALITELTKDQLEAVKNDHYITLSDAKAGEQTKAAPTSEEQGAGVADTSAEGADAPDRSASEEPEAVADQAAESEEAPAGETVGDAGEVADEAAAEDASDDAEQVAEDEAAIDSAAGQIDSEASQDAAGEEAQAGPETADDLARDNDRPTLNKMATDLGVVDADKLQNKVEVAQAIIEKRG